MAKDLSAAAPPRTFRRRGDRTATCGRRDRTATSERGGRAATSGRGDRTATSERDDRTAASGRRRVAADVAANPSDSLTRLRVSTSCVRPRCPHASLLARTRHEAVTKAGLGYEDGEGPFGGCAAQNAQTPRRTNGNERTRRPNGDKRRPRQNGNERRGGRAATSGRGARTATRERDARTAASGRRRVAADDASNPSKTHTTL